MKKRILIIAGIILVIISIGLNLYWVSQNYIEKVKDEIYQQGFNDALNAVITNVQQNNQVKIGDFILIQKQ